MKLSFNKIIEKILYDYQYNIMKILEDIDKGIIVLPTGTGKTYIQAAFIASMINKNNGGFGIYVINAPRLLLSYQLMKEVYKFLTSNKYGLNIEARYMGVNSGQLGTKDKDDLELIREETDIPYAEIHSSTSTIEIREMIKTAKRQKLPLILFSTYHSGSRIEESRKGLVKEVDLILNDEAHYLVSNHFHDNIETIKYKKQFFFTATTKSTKSDEGFGMNNEELFGKELFIMTPRQAIELGKMIRPRLHFIKTDKSITKMNLDKNIGKLIHDSYKGHQYVLDDLAAKMMITVNGSADMISFLRSKEYKRLIAVGVNIYMVHSNKNIGNMLNGKKIKRGEWLRALQKDGDNIEKKLIVMHYQIITEGLDVPGLTGVLLLRSLQRSSSIQTFGRISRPVKFDKDRLNSGELDPNELSEFIKPFAYVILPSIIAEDLDKVDYFSSLIYSLREFDFEPNEDIIITESDPSGIPESDEGPEALLTFKQKMPQLSLVLEKLENEYEDEKLASLISEEDIIDFILD